VAGDREADRLDFRPGGVTNGLTDDRRDGVHGASRAFFRPTRVLYDGTQGVPCVVVHARPNIRPAQIDPDNCTHGRKGYRSLPQPAGQNFRQ
jgi:hypothetical protein